MYVVTGAAGFIGSVLLKKLNELGETDVVIVDNYSDPLKNKNIEDKQYSQQLDVLDFLKWLDENHEKVDGIYHLGAISDTTQFDTLVLEVLNTNYTKELWQRCVSYTIPFVYASSAATYGAGEYGYIDSHAVVPQLKPLNPYGISKQRFDVWALSEKKHPPYWAGLKFFNVYGPNEYHKERMASVAMHGFNQIKKSGAIKLFKSHKPEYADGGQLRDFVYVKDVVDVCIFLMETKKESGIYNVGTGKAQTFKELAEAIFSALNTNARIEYIDMPEDIKDKYQYFTEADITKLRRVGYSRMFKTVEEGVREYVQNYLSTGAYY